MLINKPVPAAAAVLSDATIRMAGGLQCPICQHGLRPSDFGTIEAGRWRAICSGCHSTIIEIEPLSGGYDDAD